MSEQLDHEHTDPSTCLTCKRRRDVAYQSAMAQAREFELAGEVKIAAQHVPWRPRDYRSGNAVAVIGRARITMSFNGSPSFLVVHGFVVASTDPRTVGEKWVEYFDPGSGDLVREELSGFGQEGT